MSINLKLENLSNLVRKAHFMTTDQFQTRLDNYLREVKPSNVNPTDQLKEIMEIDFAQAFETLCPEIDDHEPDVEAFFKYVLVQRLSVVYPALTTIDFIAITAYDEEVVGAAIKFLQRTANPSLEAAAGLNNSEAAHFDKYVKCQHNQELYQVLLSKLAHRFIAFKTTQPTDFIEYVIKVCQGWQDKLVPVATPKSDFNYLYGAKSLVLSQYHSTDQTLKQGLLIYMEVQ